MSLSTPFIQRPVATALLMAAILMAGIAAYRRHPYVRDLIDPPAIWHEGDSRILDYGGAGPPVLFVPSLINRAYVLDLMPGRSMLRWLAANGVRPLLLDWGWPGPVERAFTLTDLIAGRLERAIGGVGEHRRKEYTLPLRNVTSCGLGCSARARAKERDDG